MSDMNKTDADRIDGFCFALHEAVSTLWAIRCMPDVVLLAIQQIVSTEQMVLREFHSRKNQPESDNQ